MPHVAWDIDGHIYDIETALRIAEEEGNFFNWVPAALRAMKNDREDGHWVSPSQAAGCLRQRVLKAETDYVLDPEKQWVPMTGTAYHLLFQEAEQDVEHVDTEIHLSHDLVVNVDGTQVEVTVQGTLDRLDRKHKRITDYKSVKAFRYYSKAEGKTIHREMPSEAHVVQANIYKWLCDMNGIPVDTVDIWYFRMGPTPTRRLVDVSQWDPMESAMIVHDLAIPVARAKLTGELPPAEFLLDEDHDMHWLCRWVCPVKDECVSRLKGEDGATPA